MIKVLTGLALAVLVSGCATTSSSDSKTNEVYYSGFSPTTDGGFVHGGTGLVCPPTLLGLLPTAQREYGDQHKDASCGYKRDKIFATVYLSELNYSFDEMFQSSVASIYQGSFGEGAKVDEEASQACTLSGLLVGASSENQSQTPYKFQPAVLYSPDFLTMVQLTEIDGKFLKLRYTLKWEPKEHGLDLCMQGSEALREVYDLSTATSRRAALN